jgi:hypothetical protein
MPPATLVEDSPNDRHQPSTSNIHKISLILGQEKGPHVDPISSSVHNLQKLVSTRIVKNNIITTIPNFPNQRTYPYSNPFLGFLSIPLSHCPNKFLIFVGGGILKVKCTTCQTNLANGYQINKCSTVSAELQKAHLGHPVQHLFNKLSLVKITFLCKNHIKILISSGTFIFHKYF